MSIYLELDISRYGSDQPRVEQEYKFTSYETAAATATELITSVSGRFPEECFRDATDYVSGYNMICKWAIEQTILSYKEAVLAGKATCTIYLELDGTTNRGTPILASIKLFCPVQMEGVKKIAREERLRIHGRYCYCGRPDCDWDCGTLECGCIDMCRTCRFEDDEYHSDW
jgi:hypothetical protein